MPRIYYYIIGSWGLVFLFFGVVTTSVASSEGQTLLVWQFVLAGLSLFVFILGGGLRYALNERSRRVLLRGLGGVLYSALFLLVIVSLNLLVIELKPFRLDTTAEQIFSLSPESRAVVERIKEPVVIRAFFYTPDLAEKTRDLLNQFADASPRIRWELVDPEKNPALAERSGITENGTLHFALSKNDAAGKAVTPSGQDRVTRLTGTIDESGVANALLKLTRGGVKKVMYLQDEGEGSLEKKDLKGFSDLKTAIQGENIVLEPLSGTGLLASGATILADALLIIAPAKSFSDVALQNISNYLRAGGRLLYLSEPLIESNFGTLIESLGVTIDRNVIVDEIAGVYSGATFGVEPLISDFADHPVTKDFKHSILLSLASSVRKTAEVKTEGAVAAASVQSTEEGGATQASSSTAQAPAAVDTPSLEAFKNVEFASLAFTSEQAWGETNIEMLMSTDPIARKDSEDMRGPMPIALAVEGRPEQKQRSQDGATVATEGGGKVEGNGRVVASAPMRVVVVGDSDFASNAYLKQYFNRDFVLNALNWLVGSEDGLAIRPRNWKESQKFLTKDQISKIFLATVIVFPQLLILFGITIWWVRRRGA